MPFETGTCHVAVWAAVELAKRAEKKLAPWIFYRSFRKTLFQALGACNSENWCEQKSFLARKIQLCENPITAVKYVHFLIMTVFGAPRIG